MRDIIVVLAWSDWGGRLDVFLSSVVRDVVCNRVLLLGEQHAFSYVSDTDTCGLSTHRAIKRVVQATRDAATTSDSSSPSTAVVLVLLAQLSDVAFRRSLLAALRRSRGEASDVQQGGTTVMDASAQQSSCRHVAFVELCLGVGRTSEQGVPSGNTCASILIPWLEGADASQVAEGAPLPSFAASAISLPAYSTDSSTSDVSMYLRNLWTDGYRESLLRVLPELHCLRWDGSHAPQQPLRSSWSCLFIGVSESMVMLSPLPGKSTGSARLGLSPHARRMILDWCCYTNRCVCFVQCGSCCSGERYPLGLVKAALQREFSPPGDDVGRASSSSSIHVPVISYFTYLWLDDFQEVHQQQHVGEASELLSSTGAHLAAAPLPLTLSGLSAVVTSCNISLLDSRLVASDHFCKTTDWLSVLPKGCCVALRSASSGSLPATAAPPSLAPLRVAHEGDAGPSAVPITTSSCVRVLPFGHRRRGELWQRLHRITKAATSTTSPSSQLSAEKYACSLEHFRVLCDSDTAKIARQYVQGNYLQGGSIRMFRSGEWSVFATALCTSSDQKATYQVEVGTIQGRVVYSHCSCPAFGKQLVCRHGAALCVCLLGVVTLELEDSLVAGETRCPPCEGGDDSRGNATSVGGSDVVDAHVNNGSAAVPFTYVPTAVAMTSSGLPAYLMASAKAEEARAARGMRAAPSTPRVNPLYLQGAAAPKGRRTTPFFYYSGRMRAAVRKEHPEWSMTDVSKHLGLLWAQMPPAEKNELVQRCKDDGDAWDAAWAEYRTTDEYRLLLEASSVSDAAVATKRRRTEPRGVPVGADPGGDALDATAAEDVPLERFYAMNPEWRCDENGQWVNDWDARDEGTSRSTVSLAAPAAGKDPKLGSSAKLMPRTSTYAGGFASRGLSEAETKASLYRSCLAFDDDDR
jgi:hypothetical protein